jgi:hypothetical protein
MTKQVSTLEAFARGEQARAAGRPLKVFDWRKAAELLRGHEYAQAGLVEDWFWTGGTILQNGVPQTDPNCYLASNWATPVLIIGHDEPIECWVIVGTDAAKNELGYDFKAQTVWPKCALDIFNKD